jgi:hypothetical protein
MTHSESGLSRAIVELEADLQALRLHKLCVSTSLLARLPIFFLSRPPSLLHQSPVLL